MKEKSKFEQLSESVLDSITQKALLPKPKTFEEKRNQRLTEAKSYEIKKRVFYPRNFNVSDRYNKELKIEIDRLMKAHSITEQQAIAKLKKSLDFFNK